MIENIRHMFKVMIKTSWPIVVISVVILASLRITYLIKNKKKFVFHEELLLLFFVMYILCLFQVVTFQDVNYGVSNYIPFKEIFRYSIGSPKFMKNVLGNIMLFSFNGFIFLI